MRRFLSGIFEKKSDKNIVDLKVAHLLYHSRATLLVWITAWKNSV